MLNEKKKKNTTYKKLSNNIHTYLYTYITIIQEQSKSKLKQNINIQIIFIENMTSFQNYKIACKNQELM